MIQMHELLNKKCEPCEGKVSPFPQDQAERFIAQVPGWQLTNGYKGIYREYVLKNFLAGVQFIQEIARIAESENHHPDIHLTGYRKLRIDLSTHAIGGLCENDFIVAAKINLLQPELKNQNPR